MLEELRGKGIPTAQENEKGLAIGLEYEWSEKLCKVFWAKRKRCIKQLTAWIMDKVGLHPQFYHFPAI